MIGKLLNSEGTGTVFVLALSGMIAVLAARGAASPGHILSGILSNPIPRRETTRVFSPTAAERRASA